MILSALLAATGCAPSSSVITVANQDHEEPFEPKVVIKHSLPPITDATFAPAAMAGTRVGDSQLVLGVTVNGQSRAYPINQLTGPSREIINDQLGGQPIAATW